MNDLDFEKGNKTTSWQVRVISTLQLIVHGKTKTICLETILDITILTPYNTYSV